MVQVCQGTRVPGYKNAMFWGTRVHTMALVQGYKSVKVQGCQGTRGLVWQGTRVSCYKGVVPGYKGTTAHEYKCFWIPKYHGSRVQGCEGVNVPGYKGAKSYRVPEHNDTRATVHEVPGCRATSAPKCHSAKDVAQHQTSPSVTQVMQEANSVARTVKSQTYVTPLSGLTVCLFIL